MDTLQRLESLQEAIQLITDSRAQVASASAAVWGKLKRAGDYLDAQVTLLLQPTLNERPAVERRGYDSYQQELAAVEWAFAEERKAVYGEVPEDRRPQRPAAEDELLAQREQLHGDPVKYVTTLSKEDLCKSWGEWLDTLAVIAEKADEELARNIWTHGYAQEQEAESEQKHQQWAEECDEIYAAEQLERVQQEQEERRQDR